MSKAATRPEDTQNSIIISNRHEENKIPVAFMTIPPSAKRDSLDRSGLKNKHSTAQILQTYPMQMPNSLQFHVE